MITLHNFDSEFQSLEHYIRMITDRIWEQRRIDDIYRYYTDPCVVETPSGVSTAVEDVVTGTRATLVAFPDRRLLCEDVIGWGTPERGYYSSHRIISPMTHLGDGAFGAATGKRIHVRTIADCWCIDNRIAHEWLVRDQSAIAKAIGVPIKELALRWLEKTNGVFSKPIAPAAPAPFAPQVSQSAHAQQYANAYAAIWGGDIANTCGAVFDEAVHAITPAETHRYGQKEVISFWAEFLARLSGARFKVEHLIEEATADGEVRVAMRWRVKALSTGNDSFGVAGKPMEIMGISHSQWKNGLIVREWILIDEVALAMQLLSKET
jgi:predicted ester cyclase